MNTARADLIDEETLAAAQREGRVGGYAADTLSTENAHDAPSPLLDPDLTDRVVLTPHITAQTVEAVDRMGSMAVANVLACAAPSPTSSSCPPAGSTRPTSGSGAVRASLPSARGPTSAEHATSRQDSG